jgi:hypothetical protein
MPQAEEPQAEQAAEEKPGAPEHPFSGFDRYLPSNFHVEVREGPQGGRFVVLTIPNQRTSYVLDFSDDAGAEKFAGELKPSRVARAPGAANGRQRPSGLIL